MPGRVLTLVFALLCAPIAGAQTVFSTTILDPRTRKECPVHLWVPEDVPIVRGLLVQMRYPHLVHRQDYRAVARLWGFALVGGSLEHDADLKHCVTTALRDLAHKSKHPEIEHAPFVLSGFANGGWMAINIAKTLPDRVISVGVRGMAGLSHDVANPAHVAAFKRIPVMCVIGSADNATAGWMEKSHPFARQNRYQWGAVIQAGGKHQFGDSNVILWPFAERAIELRLLAGADARTGPVTLTSINEADGWLADTISLRTNSPRIEPFSSELVAKPDWTWLPDRRVASIWRSYGSAMTAVKVSVSSAEAGGEVGLMAEGELDKQTARVRFFDGERLLGEAGSPPYAIKAAEVSKGIAALFAEIELADGTRVVTRPVLLLNGKMVDQEKEDAGAREAWGAKDRQGN